MTGCGMPSVHFSPADSFLPSSSAEASLAALASFNESSTAFLTSSEASCLPSTLSSSFLAYFEATASTPTSLILTTSCPPAAILKTLFLNFSASVNGAGFSSFFGASTAVGAFDVSIFPPAF